MMNPLLLRRRLMMQGGIPSITSYIQDGLSLLLDCQAECTSNKWIDQINRLEFTGSNISIQNNAPYFKAPYSYYRRAGGIGISYDTGTIEMAYVQNLNQYQYTIGMFGSRGFSAEIGYTLVVDHKNKHTYIQNRCFDGGRSNKFAFFRTLPNKITSSITSEYAILNGHNFNSTYSDYWNGDVRGYTYIGQMAGNVTRAFNGTIYSIRVYNRKLTIDEMLHNQYIDNARFDLGL